MASSVKSLQIISINSKIDLSQSEKYADFETAIHYCEYGKFQRILLLTISGLIYATCAISTTTLSFVLPSAECDFNLSSTDKGKLSAMPLIGMIFGCNIWGTIADSHGRRIAIIISLSVDFLAAFLSSFVDNYHIFLICRFFNGFGIIGATSIIFSYLGEFCSKNDRDALLGRLEIFWNIGVIILPGLAWLLLSRDTLESFGPENNNFTPWRIFVLFCSFPSLISIIMLYFLPETPKFLMSKGKYEEAKRVFQRVFAFNTNQSTYLYPVKLLQGEYDNNNFTKSEMVSFSFKFCQKFSKFRHQFLMIFEQPYLKYLSIVSFIDFGLMTSYYTLMMWFPEIFQRFANYEDNNPGKMVGVCTVSSITDEFYIFKQCDKTINSKVFLNTIIIGLSCIPTSVSLSYFMKNFGKRFVLVFSLIISGISTICLNWVKSTSETLILSCIFEACTSILEAVLFCVVVDLFPTNLRALALSLTATFGRIGAIVGNLSFGLLLDLKCVVPIYLFGFLLLVSGLLCLSLPNSDQYLILH